MRIIYVSNSRIPTEKAYGVSIVKTCSALARMRISTETGQIFANTSKGFLYKDLTYKIRGAIFSVYNSLGFGHKEVVYQKALEHEFSKINLLAKPQKSIHLIYDGKKVGTYKPDFVIADKVIVEIKSSKFLSMKDKQQTIHYLKGTGYKLALLINFGASKLQIERIINSNPRESETNLRKSEKIEVLLVAPQVRNTAGGDPFSFYDVPRNFTVRYIPTLDAVTWGWRYGFLLNQISFALALFFLFRSRRGDVLITRDEVSAFLFWLKRVPVFYDMHGFPERKLWIWKFILRRASGIFTTNEWKVNECNKRFLIPREKMVIARNGFDPELFANSESREALREKLALPEGKPIVLYTGHLYDWKGAGVLLEAARNFQFPISNFQTPPLFVFVGGTSWDLDRFRKEASGMDNVLILAHKPHREIPDFLKAADVLVLPNSAAPGRDPRFSAYSRNDTSPIKLFEYMASGRPIVASDLPSLREILNDENALFAHPDDAEDLKRGIEKLLKDEAMARTLAENAQNDVKKYTWEKRADLMLEFIQRKLF